MPLRDAGYRRTTPDAAMGRFVQVPPPTPLFPGLRPGDSSFLGRAADPPHSCSSLICHPRRRTEPGLPWPVRAFRSPRPTSPTSRCARVWSRGTWSRKETDPKAVRSPSPAAGAWFRDSGQFWWGQWIMAGATEMPEVVAAVWRRRSQTAMMRSGMPSARALAR